MSMVVYNENDMSRIKEQVVALWNQEGAGMKLVGIRFDQTPVEPDDENEMYAGIALIYSENDNPDQYFIAWGACSYSEDEILQFTGDDLESWSESGEEPWYGDLGEYVRLVTDVYPEHPEWVHLYL